jgi:hypothetical protein
MHKKIDILNIGLVIASLIIAIMIPFKLFIFSYAILGPLHYLTEINWLKDKNYFVSSNSKWIPVFIVFALLVSVYPIYKIIDYTVTNSFMEGVETVMKNTHVLLLTGFLFAIGLIVFRKRLHLIIILVGSFLLSLTLLYFLPTEVFFIGLFLPTIVHVYLFTLLFMVYGSAKSQSKFGFMAAGILLLVPFVIMFMPVDPMTYVVDQQTATIYSHSGMLLVNASITKIFGGLVDGQFNARTAIALKAQIFIAFAYTYHYLNWFSKTSIIGWKNALTKRKSAYIIIMWAAAAGLYTYDFYTGLIALYFLSMLHVFFEFPLNVITIKELFKLRKSKLAAT